MFPNIFIQHIHKLNILCAVSKVSFHTANNCGLHNAIWHCKNIPPPLQTHTYMQTLTFTYHTHCACYTFFIQLPTKFSIQSTILQTCLYHLDQCIMALSQKHIGVQPHLTAGHLLNTIKIASQKRHIFLYIP